MLNARNGWRRKSQRGKGRGVNMYGQGRAADSALAARDATPPTPLAWYH
jgi:hypothetical protein